MRVAWRLSKDPDFARIAADGLAETGPDRDWTVKEEVSGLQPGTGDTHAWWVNDIAEADGRQAEVELAMASVTAQSPFSDRLLAGRGRDLELLLNRENPHVRFVSGKTHGHIDLALGRTEAVAEFRAVSTVRSRRYRTFAEARFRIPRDGRRLRVTPERGLSLPQPALFRQDRSLRTVPPPSRSATTAMIARDGTTSGERGSARGGARRPTSREGCVHRTGSGTRHGGGGTATLRITPQRMAERKGRTGAVIRASLRSV
jgi:hypothetical protein